MSIILSPLKITILLTMYYIYKICNLTFNSHKYLTKYDDNFLQLHVFVCFCLFFVLFFRFYFLLLLAYIFLLLDIICVRMFTFDVFF
jgi:hypothetical protein